MPIAVTCPKCQQKLKAKDSLAGRTLPCPRCKTPIALPAVDDEDAAAHLLLSTADEPPAHTPPPDDEPEPPQPRRRPPETPRPPSPPRPAAQSPPRPVDAIRMIEPPPWLRHLHWLLLIALIPLAVMLLRSTGEPLDMIEGDDGQLVISSAHLARNSLGHWGYAIASTIGFLGFFLLLASYQGDQSIRLLWIGLFTATIGILVLLVIQKIAIASLRFEGRAHIVIILFVMIGRFIAFSYVAALDPDSSFLLSFLGFTAGVGLFEEVVKALPLLYLITRQPESTWRHMFLWGLASGAGFGISEGVLYSSEFYNGVAPMHVYIVRFVSCVALHALWTGSVGITAQQNQHVLYDHESWPTLVVAVLRLVWIPMVLHGLYDTLLKKEMPGFALLVSILSFLYLAWQISRLHSVDDEAAHAAMIRAYKKKRKTM